MAHVAVIGSRDFTDYDFLTQVMENHSPTLIVSGGAKGADALAQRYANEKGLEIQIFKPDWKQFGRGAGVIRNRQIVENSDYVIAFWDGQSRGTKSSIDYARKLNKVVHIEIYLTKDKSGV